MILLTSRKAAEILGYVPRHVCRLVQENKLKPFAVLDNGHNVFTVDTVQEFKAERQARKEARYAK